MPAYAVKHLVSQHGPVMANVKDLRKTPYSYTSRHTEANEAARGNYVYVIEVHRQGGRTSYALAYKYKATEAFKRPGALWKDEFTYKNSAKPGAKAEGMYFETPVEIDKNAFNDWFLALRPGMAEIPWPLVLELDAIISDPANGAKGFA